VLGDNAARRLFFGDSGGVVNGLGSRLGAVDPLGFGDELWNEGCANLGRTS
jgi:hypothetical protein